MVVGGIALFKVMFASANFQNGMSPNISKRVNGKVRLGDTQFRDLRLDLFGLSAVVIQILWDSVFMIFGRCLTLPAGIGELISKN